MPKHLTTQQVARIFHVHPNTVVLWANAGKLPYSRTPGGHRRFDPAVVERFWEDSQPGIDTTGAA